MTTIDKIKLLREETGLSLTYIKKAVDETQSLDEARIVLSQLRIQDQHDQVAKKGMVRIVSHGNIAVLYEVNALTDFVIKHDTFIKFVDDIGKVLLKHPHTHVLGLHDLRIHNQTVEDYRLQVETMIAERVVISRVSTIEKQDQQTFGFYMHHNFSSASVVILNDHHQKINEEATQIAKQVTALGALYPKWKQTVIDQILMSNLLGQPITVLHFLEKKHAQLLHATRYELGESMETHLSCSLVSNTFCQTSVKEEL